MKTKRILSTIPVDPLIGQILNEIAPLEAAPADDEQTLLAHLEGTIGIVARGRGKVSRKIIESATELKVIGRTGAGYDTVDIQAATQRGIPVVYAPVHFVAMAEATLSVLLSLVKELPFWNQAVRAGQWRLRNQKRVRDMDGMTLGIVGVGRIGREVARLAKAFRMRVIAYDPYGDARAAEGLVEEWMDFDKLLSQADYITLHAPLTEETRGMINETTIQKVKPGAMLVNLSRGDLILNLDILYQALESGQLAGVGLDVFPNEPPQDLNHPIFRHPNFLCSPHCLGSSYKGEERISRSMATDMVAVFKGLRPEYVVNPEVFA